MIYSVIGTKYEVRQKAFNVIKKHGEPTHIIRDASESIDSLIDAQSLFGETIIVWLEQLGNNKEGRDMLKELLSRMKESRTIFVIDEPFVETHFAKTLEKYSEGFWDGREEKEKGKDPFALTDAIAKRDKKTAWTSYMAIRDLDGEPVQGALWWKVKTMLEAVKQGRKTAYSEEELTSMLTHLMHMSHRAHKGEVDLKEEIEKLVLSI
jgi:DNA polymerase III delta subunit